MLLYFLYSLGLYNFFFFWGGGGVEAVHLIFVAGASFLLPTKLEFTLHIVLPKMENDPNTKVRITFESLMILQITVLKNQKYRLKF